jgi:class 3 adenylate cyclase/tetratricopeptide (TPR) repeat protein
MQRIADWLEKLGMSEYAQRFAENGIDFGVLSDLTDQDLKDIGVLLGHRRKMLRAIAELDRTAVTPPLAAGAAAEPKTQDSAERRQVTVMFSDLVGSTALSARMDPEDLREVISAYQKCVAETVRRFGGFVAKYMGDGVLIYFGYPQAHEDDAERAVRAGLELIEAVGALKTRAALQVHAGIATGLVVVGDLVGSGEAQERGIIGETPNLAARLQGIAEPNTVVIAEGTRKLLGNLFELAELGLQELKGIGGRVPAWVALRLASVESRFEALRAAHLTGLVGRADEIEFLLERQRRAWSGEGQIVLISGEPGIGKSRIAAALGERLAAEPHTRLRYQCSPYHTNSALHPFIVQLERAAGFKPEDTPEQRLNKLEAVLAMATSRVQAVTPLFAALLSISFGERYPPLALSPTQQRRQTLATLLDQLEGLARRQPVLVLFEDAHWADATSLELLDLTVERVRQLPVLALLTFRLEFEPPWIGLPNVSTLAVGGLDRNDVEKMAARVTGGRVLPAQVTEQIIAKTDGNPLFVEELTKAVLETGILVEDAEGYRLDGPLPPLAIPATLQDSLMARLDRLAPVKAIGQIGAVIGREFSYPLLHNLIGRDETALKDALAQLEQAGLLYRRGEPPEAVYSFKHALVQDAAYESLLKSRRQVLHRRIAEILRDRFPQIADTEPEMVAHHFTQAGLTKAAVEWRGKAGERALKSSAYEEAIAHLQQAISLAAGLADDAPLRLLRLRVQIMYGYALLHGRGHTLPETIAAFARARELAAGIEDPAARFSTYFGIWSSSYTRADLATMREIAEVSLRDAQRWPRSLEAAAAQRVVGATRWFQGDYVGARSYLEQALATYDPERDRYLASRFGYDVGVLTMIHLCLVLWPLGEVDQAPRLLDRALSLALQSGHIPTVALVREFACLFAAIRGHPGQARPHAEALLGLAREHGLPMRLAEGSFFIGWARWCAGDGDGEAGMREALALWRESKMHFRLYAPLTGTLLAEREAQAGRIEDGLALLNDQFATIEQTGERWFEAEVLRVRGELLLKLQRPDVAGAESAFRRAIEIARNQQTRSFELRAVLPLARLYQTIDRDQAARELLVPALQGLNPTPELPEIEHAQRLVKIREASPRSRPRSSNL